MLREKGRLISFSGMFEMTLKGINKKKHTHKVVLNRELLPWCNSAHNRVPCQEIRCYEIFKLYQRAFWCLQPWSLISGAWRTWNATNFKSNAKRDSIQAIGQPPHRGTKVDDDHFVWSLWIQGSEVNAGRKLVRGKLVYLKLGHRRGLRSTLFISWVQTRHVLEPLSFQVPSEGEGISKHKYHCCTFVCTTVWKCGSLFHVK